MGVALKLKTKPTKGITYGINFNRMCKYGLNQLLTQYLTESMKDYTKILSTILISSTDIDTTTPGLDETMINLIASYAQPLFTTKDLLTATNSYNESGLVLAAKYGQTETVRIIIDHAIICHDIEASAVINHGANGGSGLFWLLRCYSPDVFEAIQPLIKPTLYLLLQNGATVSQKFTFIHYVGRNKTRSHFNGLYIKLIYSDLYMWLYLAICKLACCCCCCCIYTYLCFVCNICIDCCTIIAVDMARYRKLTEETQVLEAFMAVETGVASSIEAYIESKQNNLSADTIESLEAIVRNQY